MRVGELATAAGVSADTIRHYESAGLLPLARRSPNGYREFPPETLERLRIVRAALAVGFTIDELARVLAERDRGGAPCRGVRELAVTKLAQVRSEERELRRLRLTLLSMIDDWDARLTAQPAGTPVHLLAHLAQTTGSRQPNARRRLRRAKKENP